MRITFNAFLAVALLSGCSAPPDRCDDLRGPLETLLCSSPSETFDGDYWRDQATEESEIWVAALQLCSAADWPMVSRCDLVQRARLLSSLEEAAAEARERLLEGPDAEGGFTGLPPGLDPNPSPTPDEPSDGKSLELEP